MSTAPIPSANSQYPEYSDPSDDDGPLKTLRLIQIFKSLGQNILAYAAGYELKLNTPDVFLDNNLFVLPPYKASIRDQLARVLKDVRQTVTELTRRETVVGNEEQIELRERYINLIRRVTNLPNYRIKFEDLATFTDAPEYNHKEYGIFKDLTDQFFDGV